VEQYELDILNRKREKYGLVPLSLEQVDSGKEKVKDGGQMKKDEFVRKRAEIISKMLNNRDEYGVYPITVCYAAFDDYFDELVPNENLSNAQILRDEWISRDRRDSDIKGETSVPPKFKVGDKVYRFKRDGGTEEGIVVKINPKIPYPITAQFYGGHANYSLDGHYYNNDKEPALFLVQHPVFEVGDEVEAFGCRGVVRDVREEIGVLLENEIFLRFYYDGRYFPWSTEISLKLINKKKKKVKKTIEAWVALSDNPNDGVKYAIYSASAGCNMQFFHSERAARDYSGHSDIQKITFEVCV